MLQLENYRLSARSATGKKSVRIFHIIINSVFKACLWNMKFCHEDGNEPLAVTNLFIIIHYEV